MRRGWRTSRGAARAAAAPQDGDPSSQIQRVGLAHLMEQDAPPAQRHGNEPPQGDMLLHPYHTRSAGRRLTRRPATPVRVASPDGEEDLSAEAPPARPGSRPIPDSAAPGPRRCKRTSDRQHRHQPRATTHLDALRTTPQHPCVSTEDAFPSSHLSDHSYAYATCKWYLQILQDNSPDHLFPIVVARLQLAYRRSAHQPRLPPRSWLHVD